MLFEIANGRRFGALQKGIALVAFTTSCLIQTQPLRQPHQGAETKTNPCGRALVDAPKIKLPDKIKTRKLNRFPVVDFSFGEDGKPFDVHVSKSTGSREVDELLVRQVKEWKFASFPGCGVIVSSMKIIIDLR
jgi:hypothetical protein